MCKAKSKKESQYATHLQPLGTRIADRDRIQQAMHYHGYYQFLVLLREAAFNASDEMEDLDAEISELYRGLANAIDERLE